MLLASLLFPSGINSKFTMQAINWIVALIPISFLIFILLVFLTNEKPLNYLIKDQSLFNFKKIERFEFKNLIFLFFPMTPIVQYVILNNEMLSISNSVIIIFFFLILTFIFAYVIPWILSVVASRETLTITSLGFLFIIFNMPLLAAHSSWHQEGSILVQLLLLILIITLLLILNFISKIIFYVGIIVFFVVNVTASALGVENVEWRTPEEIDKFPVETTLRGQEIQNKKDVLLLVYESYSNYETMKYYGFDNREQLDFLEDNGFHIYQGVYSLGTPTMPAMSQVFNLERKVSDRRFLAGGGAVHSILDRHNYKTLGVFQSDYFFRGLSIDQIEYDLSFPETTAREGAELLIDAILRGEFSDEVSLQGVGYNSYLKQKYKLITKQYSQPLFIYAHSPVPGHRPHLSHRPKDEDKHINTYIHNTKNFANKEIKRDVKKVIKHYPDAITIIAGDHGPFLTKTGYGFHLNPNKCNNHQIDRYDMQDRYGTFLAIRWPDENYATKHDIKILQDIFPAVFAYFFDDDALFEDIRIQSRSTFNPQNICEVSIKDGILVGGKDDGKPLFEGIQ